MLPRPADQGARPAHISVELRSGTGRVAPRENCVSGPSFWRIDRDPEGGTCLECPALGRVFGSDSEPGACRDHGWPTAVNRVDDLGRVDSPQIVLVTPRCACPSWRWMTGSGA